MSAFLVFDPLDRLIFSHLDQAFEHFLLRHFLAEHPNETGGERNDVIRNLVDLYLTPYMSAHRHVPNRSSYFDSLPGTHLAHRNWQQFEFVHLYQREAATDARTTELASEYVNEDLCLWLDRRTSLFCQLVRFLYGDALYSINKYEHILKTMIKMIAKWDNCSEQLSFLIESVEKIFLGFHLENICQQVIERVERLTKLHTIQQAREMPTCYMVLYRDRMLYRQESPNAHLRQEDLLSVLLLSLSVNLFATTGEDLSSEGSVFGESTSHAIEWTSSYFQNLVFLKSSINCEIGVPHIFRKVMITDELFLVSLAELSSILMISLPTMLQSVMAMKQDFNSQINGKTKKSSIANLTKCVSNVQRFIGKNVKPLLQRNASFHLAPLEQLNELSRKMNNGVSSELIREQADRILTLVLRDIHNCYEEIAFRNLYFDILPLHMRSFDSVASDVSELLQDAFSLYLDYIQVKYETNSAAIGCASELDFDLLTFVFVDRSSGTFVVGNFAESTTPLPTQEHFLANTVLRAYREQIEQNSPFVSWSQSGCNFVYLCCNEAMQNDDHEVYSRSWATCDMARIIESRRFADAEASICLPSQTISPLGDICAYELFGVFRSNSPNEQISYNNVKNIAKLIKLYING